MFPEGQKPRQVADETLVDRLQSLVKEAETTMGMTVMATGTTTTTYLTVVSSYPASQLAGYPTLTGREIILTSDLLVSLES
jgi:hypothetical protein